MIAYVSLPTDVDREEYISYCLKTHTLTVETISGGYYNRVPISSINLNLVRFPLVIGEKGSQVICMIEENGLPVVVTVLADFDGVGDMFENEMKFSRNSKDVNVEIRGSVKSQSINLIVNGNKTPSITLRVLNSKKLKGKFLLEVDGDIEAVSHNSIKNSAYNSIESTVLSDSEEDDKQTKVTQTKDSIESDSEKVTFVNTKEFVIAEGEEPMVLGSKLETLLNNLIEEISSSTVSTSLGQMPLLNATSIAKLKKDVKGILSEIAKLK